MGPIEQLVQERLPPERAEAVRGVRARRTCAAAAGGRRGRARRREALYHEVVGAFELAASRDGAPIAVRAFNPTRAEHGYEPRGLGASRPTPRTCPFLRRLGDAPSCRRAAWASCACCTRSSASSATADGGIARCCTRARRAGASRSCTSSSTGAWRPRSWPTSRTRVRIGARPTCAASCATSRRCATRVERHGRRRRAQGAARYADDEVDEVVAFLEWLRQDHFIFLGCARLRARSTARCASSPAPASGLLDDEARSSLRQAGAASSRSTASLRERGAGRRSADGLQDQPALARAPARAHGLRRHPPRHRRRRASSARRG